MVVDATVAGNWSFRLRDDDAEVKAALGLLRAVAEERAALIQPPHFIAEVAAVPAREAPETAAASLRHLLAIEMQIADEAAIHTRTVAPAARLRQHVFDALYHAVAIEIADAVLITANDRYSRKARGAGRILPPDQFTAVEKMTACG